MTAPTREQIAEAIQLADLDSVAKARIWVHLPTPKKYLRMADAVFPLLQDATHETDRLRGEAEHYGPYPLLPSARMQIARLLSVIKNAPHANDCWLNEDPDEGVLPEHRKCSCWKAEAL